LNTTDGTDTNVTAEISVAMIEPAHRPPREFAAAEEELANRRVLARELGAEHRRQGQVPDQHQPVEPREAVRREGGIEHGATLPGGREGLKPTRGSFQTGCPVRFASSVLPDRRTPA
jgi:hypothetical protein